jgi:ABC-2 type transport system permease protein
VALIGAILWAQWKSIRFLRFSSGRRGALFSALTSVLWYGFWIVTAVGLASFLADPNLQRDAELLFPAILVFVILYWQLAPILVASLGASLDLKKLLAYPIPTSSLFWVEVLLRVTTGVEMLLVLAGGAAGLIANPTFGGWARAPRIIASLLVFAAFNLLLAAGVRGVIERLLGRKHLREIFVVMLVMVGALPQLLIVTGVPKGTLQRVISHDSSVLWPWIAATRIPLHGSAAAPWAVLFAWTAAAYLFGRWQFESNLRFDIQAAQATSLPASAFNENSWRTRIFRLPSALLPDPVAAIVEKELRTLSRTPRFRLVFIMGFTFGLVVWLPLILGQRPNRPSAMVDNFLTLVCLYALALLGQVTYWNALGFDRSAAQAYFVWPVPFSRALIGKNLAAGIFVLLEMLAVTAACLLLKMQPSPYKMLEAFLVTPVVAVYLMAAGNLSSVHMPRPLSSERVAQGGSAGRSQAFMLFVYPLALLPIGLAYGARYAFDSELAFYALLVFAAGLGALIYWLALDSAVNAAELRREQIITELSRSEGPVSTE